MSVRISNMHVGEPGSGKTYTSCTFPKWHMISLERDNNWVWELEPKLNKNKVEVKYFLPDESNLKGMFGDPFNNPIAQEITRAKGLHKEGKVETLILDNITYLITYRWLWQNKYQLILSPKTGEIDTRAMYGQLRTWISNFTLMNLVNFPGNLVVNVHVMQESEEAMKKKRDKTVDTTPNIMGGFRDEVDGYFANVFYLEKLPQAGGQYKYAARTNKGSGKRAKNRFNLPPVIYDVSYQTIMDAINKSIGGANVTSAVSK